MTPPAVLDATYYSRTTDQGESGKANQGEPLVLIHGLFGSSENLGAIARQLAETFSVYSVDLPNHGHSPHSAQMSLQSLAADVLAWMDQEDLLRVHILGHSLGGKVAMELALAHPERIQSLVVLDIAPVDYPRHHDAVFAGLLALRPGELKSRTQADRQLQEQVPEQGVRNFLLKNLTKLPQGGFGWRMNLPVIHQHYGNLVAANRSDRVFEGNTLFIKGGNSDYIHAEHQQDILNRFPDAKVKIVPDTGHWLHAEKPELVAGLVERFITIGK